MDKKVTISDLHLWSSTGQPSTSTKVGSTLHTKVSSGKIRNPELAPVHSSDRQCVRVRSLTRTHFAFCLHFSVLLYIPALTNLSFSYVWWTVSLKQDLRSSTGSGLAVRGRPVCLQRVLLSDWGSVENMWCKQSVDHSFLRFDWSVCQPRRRAKPYRVLQTMKSILCSQCLNFIYYIYWSLFIECFCHLSFSIPAHLSTNQH